MRASSRVHGLQYYTILYMTMAVIMKFGAEIEESGTTWSSHEEHPSLTSGRSV